MGLTAVSLPSPGRQVQYGPAGRGRPYTGVCHDRGHRRRASLSTNPGVASAAASATNVAIIVAGADAAADAASIVIAAAAAAAIVHATAAGAAAASPSAAAAADDAATAAAVVAADSRAFRQRHDLHGSLKNNHPPGKALAVRPPA